MMFALTVFGNSPEFQSHNIWVGPTAPAAGFFQDWRSILIQSTDMTIPEGNGELFLMRRITLGDGRVAIWIGLYRHWPPGGGLQRPEDCFGTGLWTFGAVDTRWCCDFLRDVVAKLRPMLPTISTHENRFAAVTAASLGINGAALAANGGRQPWSGPDVSVHKHIHTGPSVFLMADPGDMAFVLEAAATRPALSGYSNIYVSEDSAVIEANSQSRLIPRSLSQVEPIPVPHSPPSPAPVPMAGNATPLAERVDRLESDLDYLSNRMQALENRLRQTGNGAPSPPGAKARAKAEAPPGEGLSLGKLFQTLHNGLMVGSVIGVAFLCGLLADVVVPPVFEAAVSRMPAPGRLSPKGPELGPTTDHAEPGSAEERLPLEEFRNRTRDNIESIRQSLFTMERWAQDKSPGVAMGAAGQIGVSVKATEAKLAAIQSDLDRLQLSHPPDSKGPRQ
jgi:hypothetical protein